MSKVFDRFDKLPRKQKMQIVVSVTLAVALLITIPSYAWFYSQRKAAEMFKVKYPNSLYINAAHREDRKFFELAEIDVDEEVNGQRIYKKRYAFSVSGESTEHYTLQLAYTTNNKFTYNIYKANEIASSANADAEHLIHPNAADEENVGPDENQPENKLIFNDEIAAGNYAYYSVAGEKLTLTYKNGTATQAITNPTDPYYIKTYGSNTNVHEDSVPVYCQVNIDTSIDPNTKQFCDYYILEVEWNENSKNNKETDLVYLAVERK